VGEAFDILGGGGEEVRVVRGVFEGVGGEEDNGEADSGGEEGKIAADDDVGDRDDDNDVNSERDEASEP